MSKFSTKDYKNYEDCLYNKISQPWEKRYYSDTAFTTNSGEIFTLICKYHFNKLKKLQKKGLSKDEEIIMTDFIEEYNMRNNRLNKLCIISSIFYHNMFAGDELHNLNLKRIKDYFRNDKDYIETLKKINEEDFKYTKDEIDKFNKIIFKSECIIVDETDNIKKFKTLLSKII